MREKSVTYEGHCVTVTEATVLQGMIKTRLRFSQDNKETDIDRRILAITYADLVAAVSNQTGFAEWPIPFNDFLALPEAFVLQWEEAVYALNPHWLPSGTKEETEEAEKKVRRPPRGNSSSLSKSKKGERMKSPNSRSG